MARLTVWGTLAVCSLVACGTSSGDSTANGPDGGSNPNADGGPASGPDGSSPSPDGGGPLPPIVGAPPGCDAAAEPQTSLPCVVDAYGIFVDPTAGDDAHAGTKAAPAKTIAGALGKLAGRARLYVCEGMLDEHVKLTTAVNIFGGFACQTWAYSGKQVRVAPSTAGFALDIRGVADALVVADMDFSAVDGTDALPSSVAAFVSASPKITLRRVALGAHNGANGKSAAPGATGTLVSGTPGFLCTCSNGGTSTGGAGGNKSNVGAPVNPGNAGAPAQAVPSPAGNDGAGVGGGEVGHTGSDAPAMTTGGAGASHVYDVAAEGLTGVAGSDGANGPVAQGGGGSASTPGLSVATPSLPGRAGGCGGCGGHKGLGGGGAGASIALLAFDAAVQLDKCALTSATGGKGGDGGAGGPGAGGSAGAPALAAQSASKAGGPGGTGGGASAGGGGAGGVSACIVYKGAQPTQGTTTITTGAAGAKGLGGVPGTNDGVDGTKADVIALP